MPVFKDITGMRFGRLVVIETDGKNHAGRIMWKCKCDCGNTMSTAGIYLTQGDTKSCGCYRPCTGTHGMSNSHPAYSSWKNMRSRCSFKSHPSYINYGGRGIRVCERWDDFTLFIEDMGPRPSKDHSIDRIDNDGDYCPENCRWATNTEQANNARSNLVVTFNGKTLTLAQWSRRTGIQYDTLRSRIFRNGWDIKTALTAPVNHNLGPTR